MITPRRVALLALNAAVASMLFAVAGMAVPIPVPASKLVKVGEAPYKRPQKQLVGPKHELFPARVVPTFVEGSVAPPFVLLGIVLNENDRIAVVRLPTSQPIKMRVGEKVNGWRLQTLDQRSAVFDFKGRTSSLVLTKR